MKDSDQQAIRVTVAHRKDDHPAVSITVPGNVNAYDLRLATNQAIREYHYANAVLRGHAEIDDPIPR